MSLLSDYKKTLDTLADETLLLLGDPEGERYSSSRVYEAINDTVLDFALETELVKEEINVKILEDVYEYNISLLAENDGTLREFGFPLMVGYYGDEQGAMPAMSRHVLDFVGEAHFPRGWYLDTLSPGKIAIVLQSRDGEALPDEDYNMQVVFIALPTYMSSGASYPDENIQAHFHEVIKYGAASKLLDESEDETLLTRAEYFERLSTSGFQRAVTEQYRGQTPYMDTSPG